MFNEMAKYCEDWDKASEIILGLGLGLGLGPENGSMVTAILPGNLEVTRWNQLIERNIRVKTGMIILIPPQKLLMADGRLTIVSRPPTKMVDGS
jgi:hypothetical protein